jgi:hypothetical protein
MHPPSQYLLPCHLHSAAMRRADNNRPHWYILSGSWANTNAGNPEFANIDYRLPSGFSCPNGCVLQM